MDRYGFTFKRKFLIISACVVLFINFIFYLFGCYYDSQYEKGKEACKVAAESEYSNDEIENLITDLESAAKEISNSLYYFILKEFVCVILAGLILYIPMKIFDIAKTDYLSELCPDDWIDFFCELLIIILFVWDIFISPIDEIKIYSSTLNEVSSAIESIKFDRVIQEITFN